MTHSGQPQPVAVCLSLGFEAARDLHPLLFALRLRGFLSRVARRSRATQLHSFGLVSAREEGSKGVRRSLPELRVSIFRSRGIGFGKPGRFHRWITQ